MQRILTKREKIIFFITIGVVIFSLIFNFLIFPVFKRVETLRRDINLTRLKLKKYLWLLSQKEVLKKRYSKFPVGVDLSRSDKNIAVSALSELGALAKEANIRIIDLRPQVLGEADLTKEILIDLRAEGRLEGYLKFIYNLENSLLLFKLKRLQISARPNTPLLEATFVISQPLSVE